MEAGLEDHFCGAGEGLGGEGEGLFFGEAFADPAVGEGFDDGVDVGWAAAAEAGDGVEEWFGDLGDGADGVEEGGGGGAVVWGGEAAWGERGCAFADESGGVRHHADDPVVAGGGFHGGEGDACGDGDEEFGWELVEGLDEGDDADWFDAEEDDVGGEGCGEIVRGFEDAGDGGEGCGASGGGGVADGDVVWGAEPLGDEALEEGGSHFTGAETGDFHARGEGRVRVRCI